MLLVGFILSTGIIIFFVCGEIVGTGQLDAAKSEEERDGMAATNVFLVSRAECSSKGSSGQEGAWGHASHDGVDSAVQHVNEKEE
jgi:hypothetical protein